MTANLTTKPILVWFRQDLRLHDHPALTHAIQSGRPVIALYVLDTDPEQRSMGAASQWWLNRSLQSLSTDLAALGARLVLRKGLPGEGIKAFGQETGAEAKA